MGNKFEKKFGKYAIPNLSLYLIVGYAIGFLLQMFDKTGNIYSLISLEPGLVLKGQVWRIFSWLLIPPGTKFDIFVVIMLVFYYNIGNTLEKVWGTYRYNVYLFSGFLYTLIGAFVVHFVLMAIGIDSTGIGSLFTTYYVNMSIFLAFAATFPNMEVLFMFIIPIKVKYLGIVYAAMIGIEALQMINYSVLLGIIKVVVVLCSLLNFGIFFVTGRGSMRLTKEQVKQRSDYRAKMKSINAAISKHKCAICGRTEDTHPDLEFRFCSKCSGNYEYCQDHLFTHKHIGQ